MEVHHHTHESHGKKNWKSYFWEFLMLFLAVFCGFLAEYQLEHKIERDREKVYMQNMLEDLKSDTAIYSSFAKNNIVFYNLVDSLIVLIKNPERKKHIDKLVYKARILTTKWRQLRPTERTYEDMKSSGHLRLIRKRKVADSVSYYYNSIKLLDTYNEVGFLWASEYVKAMAKIFDGEVQLRIFKERKEPVTGAATLLTEDRIVLNELITSAGYLYGAVNLNENIGKERSITAQNLIELIKKEYHLK